MRVAISNIAWDASEDAAVATLLRDCAVDAIDIAPSKYFSDPAGADEAAIRAVRKWWSDRGVEITGMQALLFGTSGFNVFSNGAVQARMLEHLDHVCRIGAVLGATRLVFGSPKNRDRSGLSDDAADEVAVGFFTRLGDIAGRHGVLMCLEPNPARYGCNFMTNAAETARVVSRVDHPHVKMQLDLGALEINAERVEDVLREHAALVGHVHVSEPDLAPVGAGTMNHEHLGAVVKAALPRHVACIEMLAPKDGPRMAALERALRVTQRCYGSPQLERVPA